MVTVLTKYVHLIIKLAQCLSNSVTKLTSYVFRGSLFCLLDCIFVDWFSFGHISVNVFTNKEKMHFLSSHEFCHKFESIHIRCIPCETINLN